MAAENRRLWKNWKQRVWRGLAVCLAALFLSLGPAPATPAVPLAMPDSIPDQPGGAGPVDGAAEAVFDSAGDGSFPGGAGADGSDGGAGGGEGEKGIARAVVRAGDPPVNRGRRERSIFPSARENMVVLRRKSGYIITCAHGVPAGDFHAAAGYRHRQP